MPITSFIDQPGMQQLKIAYSPVSFRVTATRTDGAPVPPVVFCDVYFDNIYYKTFARTQPEKINNINSEWVFDVQDACQEVLFFSLPPINGSEFIAASSSVKTCRVSFRSSGFDINGFVQTEGVSPVQGSGLNAPVSGIGTDSNDFIVTNSTLQAWENESLGSALNQYKNGIWFPVFFPLSHRPALLQISLRDSDYFPVLTPANNTTLSRIFLNYLPQGQSVWLRLSKNITPATGLIINIPAGPENLKSIFPDVSFPMLSKYFIEASTDTGTVVCTSPVYSISKCTDYVRIHFENAVGGIDAVNLNIKNQQKGVKSDSLVHPIGALFQRSKHFRSKFNIRSVDTTIASTADYPEKAQPWLSEILDSPLVWKTQFVFDQGNAYLPILVSDANMELRKEQDRYVYESIISFVNSHDVNNLRQ